MDPSGDSMFGQAVIVAIVMIAIVGVVFYLMKRRRLP